MCSWRIVKTRACSSSIGSARSRNSGLGQRTPRLPDGCFAWRPIQAGNYYVGIRRADYDTQHTGVVKLDRDWTVVTSIGFGRAGDPVFNAVHDLAVGKDGSIYVAETRTKRVVKLRVIS